GWLSARTLVAFAAGFVLLAGFVLHELHTAVPMIQIRLLCHRVPAVAASVLFLSFLAMTGTMFLIAQRLQLVMGYTPLAAAIAVAPLAVLYVVAAPSSAFIARALGARVTLVIATLLSALGVSILAVDGGKGGLWVVLVAGCVLGVSTGLTAAPALE